MREGRPAAVQADRTARATEVKRPCGAGVAVRAGERKDAGLAGDADPRSQMHRGSPTGGGPMLSVRVSPMGSSNRRGVRSPANISRST